MHEQEWNNFLRQPMTRKEFRAYLKEARQEALLGVRPIPPDNLSPGQHTQWIKTVWNAYLDISYGSKMSSFLNEQGRQLHSSMGSTGSLLENDEPRI